jgi:hypothetical protein
MLTIWWPWAKPISVIARPILPDPPVTAIFMI